MLKGLAALATAFALSIITLPGCADAGQREANKISNLGQYELSAHYRPHYITMNVTVILPITGFGDYFRPFGGSLWWLLRRYFGSGSYFGSGDGYNPCGLGRSVLEGCRPYRGY